MIETALMALLQADSGFAALCSPDAIYPVVLPDDPPHTCVSYQVITPSSDMTLDGPSGLRTVLIQYDVWSKSFLTTVSISEAIRSVFEGYRGALPDGTFIYAVSLRSSPDLYEQYARVYRRSNDFHVTYSLP